MKKLLLLISLVLFQISLFAEYKIIGYYPNWAIYRNPSLKPQEINAHLVTHINYAFIKVDASGNLILFDPWADTDYRTDWNKERPFHGNFYELNELKKKNPHLKTLFSVGGWTLSDPFSAMAANPVSRKNFVNQCIEFCDRYGFDGIDLDWEYPAYAEHSGKFEDTKNFTLLLEELHKKAKAHSPQLLVTIAAPAGPQHMQNIEIEKIHTYLDWINVMTYDFAGAGWSEITNHHAALFSPKEGDPKCCCDAAVKHYLSKGVPSSKIVLGMPLYGRSFAGADGLFKPYKSVGTGTTAEPGMRFFHDIKKNLLPTYVRRWDDVAKVPYLVNASKGEFVTYEDEQSLALKCQYIKEKKLGGAMVWELGLDVLPTWDAMTTIKRSLNR